MQPGFRRSAPWTHQPGSCRLITSAAAILLLLGGCAPRQLALAPAPGEMILPPVPDRTGPLRIDVVYPGENATVTARDSTFIFGSVGTGDATLTINGHAVRVAPNGAWLGFLPVPPDGVYNLEASARGETTSATRTVRVPAVPAPQAAATDDARLRIVEGSITPSGVFTGVRGEQIQVRVRGTPGGQAALLLPDGRRIPLSEQPVIDRQTGFMLDRAEARQDLAEYAGSFALDAPILGTDTAATPTLWNRPGHVEAQRLQPARSAVIELVRGRDTVRAPLTASLGVLEAAAPRVGIAATERPDSTVIGTKLPGPGNPYQWFFPNGTRLEITGESAGFLRVRLTDELHVWVQAGQVRLLPAGTPAPRGEVGTIEVRPEAEFARVSFATTERLPYQVQPAERGLTVTFYGASGRTGFMGYGGTDPFVESVRWEQPADDVYRVHIDLNQPLWGFRDGWDERGNLEVQLRRPPPIDPQNPLRGLRIAVDAGHPPGGAIGPTRLTEAEANLLVSRRLVGMLQRAGAEVIEIRPDTAVVPLIQRPLRANQTDSHIFVSIHFNAFPDGVNPFENHGTIVFYYWPHSRELARHFQRELLAELGTRDRGVRFQDLAIPRTQWMPAVLTETEFMMIPEIEAALRDPGVQERIARAHLRAIESFLRESARR